MESIRVEREGVEKGGNTTVFLAVRSGDVAERRARLIERVVGPDEEEEWADDDASVLF